MTIRYITIVCLYVLCVFSPLIPGFGRLLSFFPSAQEGYGILMTFIFFATLLVVLLLLLPERNLNIRSGSERLAPAGESFLWAISGIFALFILQIIASLINIAILGQPIESQHTEDIVETARNAPLFIFSVSIIGPILEEIVFRKILYGSMKKKIGFIFAALISSLIFALGHFDLSHLLVYFVIGFFLCYVYYKTGRIIVNIFMHAGMNAIVVAVSMNVPVPKAPDPSFIQWLLFH